MTGDIHVSPEMWTRIEGELDAVEREHGVRILFAVESGSRGWRFPSRDSDYDVRFVYARPPRDYLTVWPGRDVIERPLDATLDVNGWDLRKALQLLLRSNAVLIEWLTSPVVYRAGGQAAAHLLQLARDGADLTSFTYHYDRQTRRTAEEIAAAGDAVRLKTYCYALRTALSVLWLRRRREAPPMDLPSLRAGLALGADVSTAIDELIARKIVATERDTTARITALDALIDEALAEKPERAEPVPRREITARADALFASIVLGDEPCC
ncbi:MAG: nucleotidyltransferase domain-containing protein [Alphaproteobacteria bacterium]|nr:nucleotidyltransferase domain-containing protein [Alphaproteobacteria bacterium]